MKLLFSGDWQLTIHNLDRCKIVVEQICTILAQYKDQEPCYFVHLGDIKEKTNPVDQRVTNFIIWAWELIAANCHQTFFIRGNHDGITTQDDVPSCTALIEALGAEVVAGSNWERTYLGLGSNAVGLWLVPYFRDPERQKQAFISAAKDARLFQGVRLLAFHNEVAGCERSAYMKGEGLTLEDIQSDLYQGIVSGHIHRPHTFGNVQYAGSPFCMDWGECNEEKSLLLLTLGKGKSFQRIPTAIPGWYDPSVPGFNPPKNLNGCTVRVTVPVVLDPVRELREARAKLAAKYPGAILKIVPDFQSITSKPDTVDLKGGDQALLQRYLEKQPLPSDVTVDQLVAYLETFLPKTGTLGVQGLHFRSVTATNVLPFEQVELDLDRKGLTLITAVNHDWGEGTISNGGGKSSLVSLPFIGLFGKTFKGQANDEWARQECRAAAIVDELIGLPDGREMRIERGRRPPLLRVYLDDVEVTMGDKNATQLLIERLTNLTWDVLTNAVYIGQREIGSVFGTDKERKELFSRLLGLERFLEAQEKLRRVALKRQRAVEAVEGEIASAESALEEAENGLEQIQEALNNAPQVDARSIKDNAQLIQDKGAEIRRLNRENEALQPTLETNQREFEDYLSKAASAEVSLRGLREQMKASAQTKGRCTTCGQKVTVAFLESYIKELAIQVARFDREAEQWENAQEKNRTVRRALMKQFQDNNLKRDAIQRELFDLQQASVQLKEQLEARQRLEGILNTKKLRKYEMLRRKHIHELALQACLAEKQFVDVCVNATGRNGLPAYLCSVAAPQLNLAAVRYSQIFTEGEIGVQFQMSNGDIEPQICNLHGGNSFKDQSAGETRMAALITALAFRDVLVPHNLLVLDEPSEGLDGINAAAFARGLNSVVERFQHVMVISHNAQLLENLEPDFHLEVSKRDGISTVREV